MKDIIGIDPGRGGGVAIITCEGAVTVYPMPKRYKDRGKILSRAVVASHERPGGPDSVLVVLEEVHSIHGSSAKSNFTFGGECHSWIAIVEVLGIPMISVPPATWQGVILAGKPKRPSTKDINDKIKLCRDIEGINNLNKQKKDMLARHKKAIKEYAHTTASRLYPGVSFLATPGCSTPHDGMVDALLIAEYGRRTAG